MDFPAVELIPGGYSAGQAAGAHRNVSEGADGTRLETQRVTMVYPSFQAQPTIILLVFISYYIPFISCETSLKWWSVINCHLFVGQNPAFSDTHGQVRLSWGLDSHLDLGTPHRGCRESHRNGGHLHGKNMQNTSKHIWFRNQFLTFLWVVN